jgi:hypothetical protein
MLLLSPVQSRGMMIFLSWGGRKIELLASLRSIGLPPSSPAKPVTSNGQTGVFPTPFLFDLFHHNTNKKAPEGTFYLRVLGRKGSNLRMEASKAPALPLGYSPVFDCPLFRFLYKLRNPLALPLACPRLRLGAARGYPPIISDQKIRIRSRCCPLSSCRF